VNATLRPGSFFGETLSLEIAGVVLSEVRHHVGRTVPPHAHAAAYFALLLEGSYEEIAGDVHINCGPFTVIFHTANTEHSNIIAPTGCCYFFAELSSRWTTVIDDLGDAPKHVFELHGGDPTWLMVRLYHEFLAREAASTFTVESLLFELCTYLSQQRVHDTAEPPWLARVDALVQAEFRHGISVQTIAAQVGINPSHLCRAFRQFRGRTLGDYVLGLRMQHVCQELAERTHSLGDIALDAGFTDQSHLTRTFKQLMGVTPGAYRRMRSPGGKRSARTGA
jgi:AraC family transcriptional regulator